MALPEDITLQTLMNYMQIDKKNKNKEIHFVFIEYIGKAYQNTFPVSKSIINTTLANDYLIKHSLFKLEKPLEISLPGSKSLTNRVFLLSALAEGVIKIRGALEADDTKIMLNALIQLKVCDVVLKTKDLIILKGKGGRIEQSDKPINIVNSGTSARFLTSLFLLVNSFLYLKIKHFDFTIHYS